jgi:hypothetical protein
LITWKSERIREITLEEMMKHMGRVNAIMYRKDNPE